MGYTPADRITFIHSLNDLLPGDRINNLSADVESLFVNSGFLSNPNCGKLVHFPDVAEFHIIAQS